MGLAVDAEHHLGQERGLGPGEVIGAVGVEDRAVLVDLVDEVLRHVPCPLQLAVAQQADLDEEAVPAVHLVESPPGHHVGTGQVEQAVVADRARVGGKGPQLDLRQLVGPQERLQLAGHAPAVLARREIDGRGLAGRTLHLRVHRRPRQVAVGAGERPPCLLDVGPHGLDALGGRHGFLGRDRRDAEQDSEARGGEVAAAALVHHNHPAPTPGRERPGSHGERGIHARARERRTPGQYLRGDRECASRPTEPPAWARRGGIE